MRRREKKYRWNLVQGLSVSTQTLCQKRKAEIKFPVAHRINRAARHRKSLRRKRGPEERIRTVKRK